MKRLQRAAILLSLIEKLENKGSWCGETHIQKATYFLKEMTEVPLEFEFILYKHGPYSFDLTQELTELRADTILDMHSRDPKYGPSYVRGAMWDYVFQRFPKSIKRYAIQTDFVAEHLGNKGIAELERLATALYVKINDRDGEAKQQAARVVKYKRHITMSDALDAVRQVQEMLGRASQVSVG